MAENGMQKKISRLSIREFVEGMFLEGDLTASASSPLRAVEGTRIHKRVQADRGDNYRSEVSVNAAFDGELTALQLFGRIDGLITDGDSVTIEEIKSVRGVLRPDFDGVPVHWAQAKCYGAIYSLQNGLAEITIELVYVQLGSEATARYPRRYAAAELQEWLQDLCQRWLTGADREAKRLRESAEAIRAMGFPFTDIRPGQKEMIEAVYDHVRSGDLLYVCAPTGIGKTMGALFPAVKAMADGHCEKLFYLTARNPVKRIAEEALIRLIGKGFPLRSITMSAKDKLCPMPEGTPCNPEFCPRAAGFYDRLWGALDEAPPIGHMDTAFVERLAHRHNLCPHELSLFLAEICDVVICDYNNVFDPRVRYQRFFDRGGDYQLLVDEAHNLIDRARDMFSAVLDEMTCGVFLRSLPLMSFDAAMDDLAAATQALLDALLAQREELHGNEEVPLPSPPKSIVDAAQEALACAEPVLMAQASEASDELLNLYFMVRTFLAVAERFDECYRVILRRREDALELNLRCLDPSKELREVMERVHGAVFYSATLTPFGYYARLIGGSAEASFLMLPSPYPHENLQVSMAPIDTTYARRDGSLSALVDALSAFVGGRVGNYLVFFPSYQYMAKAHQLFSERNPQVFAPMQASGMSERERAAFLAYFDGEHEGGMAAFAVMGGIFGEGIDLTGERVIGVAIVGVGIPQISLERSLIQQYHDERNEPGYDYAYTIPGMGRVLQAVGRLIRSGDDRGVALLLDRRFGWQKYDELTPEWWKPVRRCAGSREVERSVKQFWQWN